MARVTIKKGLYYHEEPVRFFSSGCTLLDCVLGGGFALNRVINLVGDRSTGKTLLAIEAAANFALEQDDAEIVYVEAEAAFDERFARALGFPFHCADFPEGFDTVEDVFEDITERAGGDHPVLYIVDSLDSLTTRGEMKRDIDQGSYGTEKAKAMSQLFRRLVRKLKTSQITLAVISQVRDKIGVTFGERHTRSGGRALDFYASQILWLSQVGTIKKKSKKVERPIGIRTRAKCKKNKVGLPFRECDLPILFNYGIDDPRACLEWLASVGELERTGIAKSRIPHYLKSLDEMNTLEVADETIGLAKRTKRAWKDIERRFRFKRRPKYERPEKQSKRRRLRARDQ